MKKKIVLISSLLLFYGFISSQTIKVDYPDHNSKWIIGNHYDIKWTKTGNMNANVKIRLFNATATQKMLNIVNSTPNTGIYSWTIPNSVSQGDYILRIKTIDDEVMDDSEVFNISVDPSKPKLMKEKKYNAYDVGKIEILAPSKSSNWKEGSVYSIKWKDTFRDKKTTKIDLYNYSGNKFLKTIATILPINVIKIHKGGVKSSGVSYNWFIPKGTYVWPGNFRIKISRTSGGSAMSEQFHIEIVPKVSEFKINGLVDNRCKRKYWQSQGVIDRLKEYADKIPCRYDSNVQAWVGYSYRLMFKNNSAWVGDVFRSFVYFDVSGLQGKGVVLSAKLHYQKTSIPLSKNCKISIYRVNNGWSDPFKVNADFLSSNPEGFDLKTVIWSWIGHPGDNHGLMFIGPDESFSRITSKCRAQLDNIYIEIKFAGK